MLLIKYSIYTGFSSNSLYFLFKHVSTSFISKINKSIYSANNLNEAIKKALIKENLQS